MNSATQVAAVILAAGASSRMGSPKPLLELDGETFLDRLIGLFAGVCRPVVVVLGYNADRIRAGIRRGLEAEIVVNPAPERGMLSSLQCGLARVTGGAMFTPVDYPCISRATVEALAAVAEAPVAMPTFAGRRGHPVRVSPEVAAELRALPLDAQARDVIRRHSASTVFVEVADEGIVNDIDTPEAYRELMAQWSARV